MTHQATLIFPHQLFSEHPAIAPHNLHILVEDPLFFGDRQYPARFHALKLVYHRACMRRYRDEVLYGFETRYIDYAQARTAQVLASLAHEGITTIHIADPVDFILQRRLRHHCHQLGLQLVVHPSPNFLTTPDDISTFYAGRKPNAYHQTDFYIWQRQRLGLLLTDAGQPTGGRWTYDTDNRHKLPTSLTLPSAPSGYDNRYLREARAYVAEHFPDNPGTTDHCIYPTNADEAEDVLNHFVSQRLHRFGPYQDAITARDPFLFHSLLSAPLNCGLLSPQQVIQAVLRYYEAHPDTSLASVEGFVRQVAGWREFMRAVYVRAGVQQRTSNFFDHQRDLEPAWYEGTTGLIPVDDAIRKAGRYAYAHHIERLMLIGNAMLLCEIHPDQVYRWFMEMFIDAYDWVMVPNVYGMSQYADGGLITTKPYISSSNYVRRMSDYGRGPWSDIWDGLYWRFVHKHQNFFGKNPRMGVMASQVRKMAPDRLHAHLTQAEAFLASQTTQFNPA